MSNATLQKPAYHEVDMQKAISAVRKNEYPSIQKNAIAFGVPYPTLEARMSGQTTRANAHKLHQILSNAEERTPVQWITRLTHTGYPNIYD